jgi:AcrR family transcriptional regulator
MPARRRGEGNEDQNREQPAKRRKRNHLSRELIVTEAVEMLKEGTLAALTLRGLAKRLGVGPMSLYTHYASRDALLSGVADHVFALFEAPDMRGTWQDYVRDWLWATYRLFDRFPVAPKVIRWDDHVCSAWLKTWFPIAIVLKEQGLDGDRLTFALDWFSNAAMGFIQAHMDAGPARSPSALAFLSELNADEQRLAVELWSNFQNLEAREALEFGFGQLIRGLEVLVAGAGQDAGWPKVVARS